LEGLENYTFLLLEFSNMTSLKDDKITRECSVSEEDSETESIKIVTGELLEKIFGDGKISGQQINVTLSRFEDADFGYGKSNTFASSVVIEILEHLLLQFSLMIHLKFFDSGRLYLMLRLI